MPLCFKDTHRELFGVSVQVVVLIGLTYHIRPHIRLIGFLYSPRAPSVDSVEERQFLPYTFLSLSFLSTALSRSIVSGSAYQPVLLYKVKYRIIEFRHPDMVEIVIQVYIERILVYVVVSFPAPQVYTFKTQPVP